MSNTTLILLIIAGVIALIVLQMTSSKPSEQVSDKESKPVKDSKVETPKDSPSSVKERFSYSENMTDSAQEYNMENYTQDQDSEQDQEQDSEQDQDQEQDSEQDKEQDEEHFDQDQEEEHFDQDEEHFEQPQDSEQDQEQEQESEQEYESRRPPPPPESDEELEGFSQNSVTGSYQPTGSNVPKAEFVIKSALQGNNFGGGKFNVKLTGKEAQVGPNTTNVNALSLGDKDMDFTLGVTPVVSKEKKAKKLTAKDLLPVESKDDWFDMPYDKKQMMRIENENLLAGSSTQARIGIDTQGQTLKNASHDLRACPPNPKFAVGPWQNSTIEPDYNIKPIM